MNPRLCSIIAVFTAILGVSAIGSAPSGRLLFSITSENIARIGVINSGNKNVNLNVINSLGETIYSQIVQGGENYFKLFDLSKLPDGNYSIKISGNIEETEKKFTVSKGKAELIKTIAEIPPKYYMLNEETFMIYYQNSQNEIVDIAIEKNNETVFTDNQLKGSPIKKSYSIKELPKGNYMVFITANKKVYSYNLSIK